MERSHSEQRLLSDVEQELFGFCHADVSAELLRSWNLPEELCEAVGSVHDIQRAQHTPLDAAILHVADVIANRAEMSSEYEGALADYNEQAWAMMGLDESIVPFLMDQAEPLFAESWALIQPMVRHVR